MKKLSLLGLLAILLASCAGQTQTMMGERTSLAPEAGQKILVGKFNVLAENGKPWDGNVQICLSAVSNPASLNCDYATFIRPKCAVCKAQTQADIDNNTGYVIMPVAPGLNELREIHLTHTTLKVGDKGYTYFFRAFGFVVDANVDVTNFGTVTFKQIAVPNQAAVSGTAVASSSTPKPPALSIDHVDAKNTDALTRYQQLPTTPAGQSVSTQEKNMFLDKAHLRMQVQSSVVTMHTVYTPVYMPVYHH